MAAVPVERWGPFLPDTVTCLRAMSRAAGDCFERVLEIEQQCRDASAGRTPCDTAGRVAAATDVMLAALDGACRQAQLSELHYFDLFDARADLVDACAYQARAAMTAAYAPAAAGGASDALACMAASATYGRKTMHFILDRKRPVMERFAVRLFPDADKLEQVRQSELELAATRARWITGLLAACPTFEAVYGRTPESFLRTLKQRTDCVQSKIYVNSAALCLTQVCGNGIPEGHEECDDGNTDDGDACRNDCTQPGSR